MKFPFYEKKTFKPSIWNHNSQHKSAYYEVNGHASLMKPIKKTMSKTKLICLNPLSNLPFYIISLKIFVKFCVSIENRLNCEDSP